ncbi:hypothetical protein M9H77_14300 [Catharanthus roseus]|uniref:Uncharacterized protein n=1 Tax=Catharanthus roseus TaxID=4058 RepID=A0ACC0BMN6_CATRO|nr:hypothetical protein M9H77_14300 [Catharanthus roseus]
MGSGSPIDDLVESCTIWLLNWNDSMTDIQLSMRFVNKVQAISAVYDVKNLSLEVLQKISLVATLPQEGIPDLPRWVGHGTCLFSSSSAYQSRLQPPTAIKNNGNDGGNLGDRTVLCSFNLEVITGDVPSSHLWMLIIGLIGTQFKIGIRFLLRYLGLLYSEPPTIGYGVGETRQFFQILLLRGLARLNLISCLSTC